MHRQTCCGAPGGLQTLIRDTSSSVLQFAAGQVIEMPDVRHHVAVVVDIDAPSAKLYLGGAVAPTTLALTQVTRIYNNAAQFSISIRAKVNGTPKALRENWAFDG